MSKKTMVAFRFKPDIYNAFREKCKFTNISMTKAMEHLMELFCGDDELVNTVLTIEYGAIYEIMSAYRKARTKANV